jgi:hypothetical protein
MVASDAEGGTATAVRFGSGPSAYDPDDMFGVRRALGVVAAGDGDRFFDRWVEITECCKFDVRRIHTVVRQERCAADTDAARFAAAWATVDEAMTAYLGWRALR